jgi:hypothetical protein
MERIEQVKNTPNAYCIMNGDIMDNATKTSIGDTYTQVFNPMEQLAKAVALFQFHLQAIYSLIISYLVRVYKEIPTQGIKPRVGEGKTDK